MKKDKVSVLEQLYEDSNQDKNILSEKIQKNRNRINEIDIFLNTIMNSEDADIKVFSPRSLENKNKQKISDLKNEKKKLEDENETYFIRLKKLENHINELKIYLVNDDTNKHLKVLDIQEKERIRIARELHDSSLQNLTHLVHTIELSSMFIDQDPIRAKLELASCTKNLKQVINEIRDTIFDLRPMSFDDLGFKQCIENYIGNLKQNFSNFLIIYEVDDIICNLENGKLNEKENLLLVTIYRIIQEAMMNAVKHSGAEKLELYIKKKDDGISILIIDNGKGFSLEENLSNKDKHFGLSIMYERVNLLNGKIEFQSEIGLGTKIKIFVPV